MGNLRSIVVALALLLSLANGLARAADAGVRIAVVIGNAHYQNAPTLKNPGNDATDVAAALTELGFKVTLRLDVTKRQLDQTLEQFSRDAKGAAAAVFFYAGHGMQFRGRNYLVPVDAELLDEVSVRYETTAVDDVKDALRASSGVKILILDSCRDNPLTDRLTRSLRLSTRDMPRLQGFARDDQTNGMIIVYSTQPDEVAHDGEGRNSPFSAALLKELKEPGLEIGALFRRVESDVYKATDGAQSPELSISMAPEYYLNQSETDQTVWARIRASADAATLKEFIARYPRSFYAPDAHARLDLLEAQAREQAVAEQASASARAAAAEAERLKSRQQALDAAAEAAKSRERQLDDQLAAEGKEEARLRDQLTQAAQQRAKDGEAARSQAAKDSQDRAQREATLKTELAQLQAGDLEKQQALQKQLDDERARAEAAKQAAADAKKAADDKDRADADKAKALAAQQSALAAEVEKARAEAERQAHAAADARDAAETARRQVAAADAAATPRRLEAPAPDLLPQIRDQLRRLGCYSGADVDWSAPALKLGVAKYARYASLGAPAASPDQALLDDMKKRRTGLCPPECSAREVAIGGRCVAKTCPEGERLSRGGGCVRPKPPVVRDAAVRPRRKREAAPAAGGGRCFTFNGSQYCE